MRVVCEGRTYQGKPVAIKEWKTQPSTYERVALEREIQIQHSLNHPNCVALYGTSKTPTNEPVLVLELADGALTDYTTKNTKPRLTNQEKCRIIREIAEGLEYIHSLGYIHRDIKVSEAELLSASWTTSS